MILTLSLEYGIIKNTITVVIILSKDSGEPVDTRLIA